MKKNEGLTNEIERLLEILHQILLATVRGGDPFVPYAVLLVIARGVGRDIEDVLDPETGQPGPIPRRPVRCPGTATAAPATPPPVPGPRR